MSYTLTQAYLDEIISYGGILTSRGTVIKDMQSHGATEECISRWFQGYELLKGKDNP